METALIIVSIVLAGSLFINWVLFGDAKEMQAALDQAQRDERAAHHAAFEWNIQQISLFKPREMRFLTFDDVVNK